MNVVSISQLPDGGFLQPTDLIHVARGNYAGSDFRVTLNPTPAPTGEITIQEFFTTGSTGALVSVGTFVGWASFFAGPKTQPIPASTGKLGVITISDIIGTAELYPITAVPVSGPAIIGVNQVYTEYGSITLRDTAFGWVST